MCMTSVAMLPSTAVVSVSWCTCSYSRTSNKGPSEKGTLYVKPLYRGHCLGSQELPFPIYSLHSLRTSEKRTTSLQSSRFDCIALSYQIPNLELYPNRKATNSHNINNASFLRIFSPLCTFVVLQMVSLYRDPQGDKIFGDGTDTISKGQLTTSVTVDQGNNVTETNFSAIAVAENSSKAWLSSF